MTDHSDTQEQQAAAADATTFWDRRYQEKDQIWSGRVNPVLAEVVGELEVGSALDLGCGEGGDAVWLAGMGWRVTGIDISETALQRARTAAEQQRVDARTSFERHDLATDFPSGTFDLVSAQYLHSPVDFPRGAVLQQAARAVALGGRLLIVDHGAPPPWMPEGHEHPPFPTVQQTFDELGLIQDHWRVERLEAIERPAVGPDGQQGVLLDNIILVCRLA
ncbi:class I SAM-dependent methyltransferase [Microlunatus soli]|uniref:Methyltransferase domain-containing protein n=1 Tax=Microlunatus soli TaxID=630515 RepID=A0A1H2AF69_9ACTN|nr:class I SAM-dependent methyltransferase [Microlunatus soli]SDT44564.1 Methyltransferase domain-containing protein [Microlunatus soli]